ncbi:MAG: hypothetical protein JXR37_31865 [Kiritimatiellae bacterium]|nr:hypothetical protein [Kiritimatiellia bacterium]
MRAKYWRRLVAECVVVVAFFIGVSCGASGPEQDFSDKSTYKIEPFYGGTDLRVTELEKPGPSGRPALELQVGCPRDNAGVNVTWAFPPRVLDKEVFSVSLLTPGGPLTYVRAVFLDAAGKRVCRNNYFSVAANDWRQITFSVGGKTGAASTEPKDVKPGRPVASIRLQFCGKAGKTIRAVISDFAEAGKPGARPAVARKRAEGEPAVSGGGVGIWLDASGGYALSGVKLGERWFEPNIAGVYPRFTFLDKTGKRVVLGAGDSSLTVKAEARGAGKTAVRYSRGGTTLEVVYSAAGTVARCDVTVVEEGDLKLVLAGTAKILGTELGASDYGITPAGALFFPCKGQAPRTFKRRGNADNAVPNFTAARVGDSVVIYNPLTASQEMCLTAETLGGAELIWFGGDLQFRPDKVKNPATKLCHETLSWQLETAGDENGDGAVDWVDAGIAYRDRHMKRNASLAPSVRDSLKFYHGVPGDTYEQLARVIEKMDYCSTLWWVKGAMKTNIKPGSEAHPYVVEPDPGRGDRAAVRARVAAAHGHVGIYYGHDYLDNHNGDWPEELIKLDENGNPHPYYMHHGHRLHYKDNVRGLASGALKEHYEEILRVCKLQAGDPVMLDTFTAYARPGYHPDYPATPQIETGAKRELCRWFKQEHGLPIAGESVIEGTEDMLDFGAILCNFRNLTRSEFWKKNGWVPLLSVVYHGCTYTGVSVYEYREPDPNWAAALVTGCSLWQWSTGHYPDMYAFGARMFFHQNSAWIPCADARITDVDRTGTEYRIAFDNGNTLWADPGRNAWRLEAGGVLYDGFTPFNSRGVMAILKQGDFDLTLPVKDMLEIIPSQPHRDKLDVTIARNADGHVRVRGNFSKIPWKMKWYHKPAGGGKDVVDMREVEPVLMLRRAGR